MKKYFSCLMMLVAMLVFTSSVFAGERKVSDWEFQIGLDLKTFPFTGAGTLPIGYQFDTTKRFESEMFFQCKYDEYIALAIPVNFGGQDVTLYTFASGLNTIHVYTPVTPTLKAFPFGTIKINKDWSVYPFVGLSADYTKFTGSFSEGAINFDTSGGDNFSLGVPIGLEFGGDLRGFIYYKIEMIALDTYKPNTGILEYQQNGSLVFGTSYSFRSPF